MDNNKFYEKVYYFSKWIVPIKDFKEFFKNDYIESEDEKEIELLIGGQDINGYTFNIFWKSEYDNVKGEIKFINWKCLCLA